MKIAEFPHEMHIEQTYANEMLEKIKLMNSRQDSESQKLFYSYKSGNLRASSQKATFAFETYRDLSVGLKLFRRVMEERFAQSYLTTALNNLTRCRAMLPEDFAEFEEVGKVMNEVYRLKNLLPDIENSINEKI